jgi:putative membrane protein
LRKRQDYIFLYIKGIVIGAAETVPGVSGSTGAILTNVYHELVTSIRSIDRHSLKLLYKKNFSGFWQYINGSFLLTILAGTVTGILGFSRLILYGIKHSPIPIGAFFFSLIIMSAPLVMREEIKKWDTGAIICFLSALLIAYAFTHIPPTQLPRALWVTLIAGVIAGGIALIPGISFTFILILLGQYEYIASTFAEFTIIAILIFIIGYALGLAGFARIVYRVLDKFRRPTIAILTGVMLGFLNKVWPWREVVEYATNTKGEQIPAFDKSILPWNYYTTTGKDPQVLQAILMMALGVFIVVVIEKIASRRKTTI